MEEAGIRPFDEVVALLLRTFSRVVIRRRDESAEVCVFEVECVYGDYRVVVSEILTPDGRKYAFYLLDSQNAIVVGFDNSPDRRAAQLRYGPAYRKHIHERIPHRHDLNRLTIHLTVEMTLSDCIAWLHQHIPLRE